MKSFYLTSERTLISILLVLVGLTFLIPLITLPDFYFPFIVPRNIAFRLLVDAMVFVYLILVLQNRRYLFRMHPIVLLFFTFVGLITISSLAGVNVQLSFWSTFERMDGLVTLYHLGAYFLILYGAFREKIAWERVLQMSLFASMIVAFIGLSQFFKVDLLLPSSGGERITSTLGNATYFGAYLTIHFFIAVYFLLKKNKEGNLWFFKYGFLGVNVIMLVLQVRFTTPTDSFLSQFFSHPGLWIPFVILEAIAMLEFWRSDIAMKLKRHITIFFYGAVALGYLFLISTTQTRGALVGLGFAALVVYFALLFNKRESRLTKILSSVFITVVALMIVGIFFNKDRPFIAQQPILHKISTISPEDRTSVTRLATWRAGLSGFNERPLFGWGLENFHEVFNKYFPTIIYVDEGTPLWFDRPHNILIQYLVEGGIITFAAYITFLGMIIYHCIKRIKEGYLGLILAALIIAYIGQNLFVFDSINSTLPLYMMFSFIMFLLTYRSPEQRTDSTIHRTNPHIAYAVIAVMLVLLVGSAWWFGIKPAKANTQFASTYTKVIQQRQIYDETLIDTIFNAVDATGFLGKAELIGVVSEYAVDLLNDQQINTSQIADLVTKVLQRFDQVSVVKTSDARIGMFEMNLLLNAERLDAQHLDRLFTIAARVEELSPERPQIYYLTGRAHMLKGEFDEGLADFIRAVQLAPDVFDARWNLFIAYISLGNREAVISELLKLQELDEFDILRYQRVSSVLTAGKYYDLAEQLLQAGIDSFPREANLYATLADFYRKQNRNEESRAAAEKAIEVDPSYEAEARAFINSLGG